MKWLTAWAYDSAFIKGMRAILGGFGTANLQGFEVVVHLGWDVDTDWLGKAD